jgi:hypothetical protein
MKTSVQQEILLMTGTSFASRQCWQKKEETGRDYSEKENLQEACWNGLLPRMLPEIFQPVDKPVKLYLWNIKENKSGIEIDLAENPGEMEKDFSIDPYAFMDVQLMN